MSTTTYIFVQKSENTNSFGLKFGFSKAMATKCTLHMCVNIMTSIYLDKT